MAVTSEEKELWSKLNLELGGSFDCVYGVAGVLKKCNEVLTLMREIIKSRGKSLKNKKEGIGVKGMRDILGSANLLYEDSRVYSGNFWVFVDVLEAISKLPRGSYPVLAWLRGSALSENTKKLCGKAAKIFGNNFKEQIEKMNTLKALLDENSDLEGSESRKADVYGCHFGCYRWREVDNMSAAMVDNLSSVLKSENSELGKKPEQRHNKLHNRIFEDMNSRKTKRVAIDGKEYDLRVVLSNYEFKKLECIYAVDGSKLMKADFIRFYTGSVEILIGENEYYVHCLRGYYDL